MDIENKEYIEELLKNLRTDAGAPKKLLQLFASQMYSEAKLYISDKEEARNMCTQAFSHAYSALSRANAEDVEDVLKKAVQDECIRTTFIEGSSTVYTSDDEIPDENAAFPEDPEKVNSGLRSILDHLTPAQRLIAVLKYRDGLSFSTIADKLDISEAGVKGILQDAKNSLNNASIDTGMVFALVNKVFPYYEAPEPEESVTSFENDLSSLKNRKLTEEEQFTTTLSELKDFFNTAAVQTGSMNQGNSDEDQDDDQKTMEMHRVIDDDSDDEDYSSLSSSPSSPKTVSDPIVVWGKRIAIILALLAVGFGISIGISALHSRNKTAPVTTPEPVATETAEPEDNTVTEEPEATPEPEETPEPDDGIIGSGYINVTDLTIRTGPGVNYEQNGITQYGETYDVYEVTEADGYNWYRVGEGQWVADYQGQYVIYTPKE